MVPRNFRNKRELQEIMDDLDPATQYIQFQSVDMLHLALTLINNDRKGVCYLIDEMHIYFNSVAEGGSKNVPMYVFTEISQQRKQRKCIIGTSQIFTRLSKPFREQCDNVILCRTFLGVFTMQSAWDGMSLEQDFQGNITGNRTKRGFFYHTKYIRTAYDTYQKVVSAVEQYEAVQKPMMIEQPKKLLGFRK
jgi:hypothetical protein